MATSNVILRYSRKIINSVIRGIRIAFLSVTGFGVVILGYLLVDSGPTRAEGQQPSVDQRVDSSYLKRVSKFFVKKIQDLCRPTSVYIPILSSTLAMLFVFRALEDNHMFLPGTKEYETICPEGSRRTPTGALVKLFAATVTTVGVYGHLSSLKGSVSWKRELVRAVEVVINPLAPVFSFTAGQIWYGFIDLLGISRGPWDTEIALKYRFARLCGCGLTATAVSPCHLEMTPLERDLKWAGRLFVLLVLLGQYTQAAVLLIRRFLTSTVAGVDYAMLLLALSGLVGLFQSITISLLNLSWTLQSQVQPCTEPLCRLAACTSFKKEQGLPHQEGTAAVFGYSIVPSPRTILYQLAGGYAQYCITLPGRDNTWTVLRVLYSGHLFWLSSFYCGFGLIRLRSLFDTEDREAELAENMNPASDQQRSEQLPPTPLADNSGTDESESSKLMDVLIPAFLFVVGMLAFAWLCISVLLQLSVLVAPCAILYMRIASETASWKDMDPMKPCPQLWKDSLEDELWWF